MFGSIIGDIVGSTFEVENHRSKFFELFRKDARFTDDTILTVAISDILIGLDSVEVQERKTYIYKKLRSWCSIYLNRGFGSLFNQWIISGKNLPYKSYGNNCLVRISPLIIFSKNKKLSLEDTLSIGKEITEVTHDTQEAINCVSCYLEIAYDIVNYNKNFTDIILEKINKYQIGNIKPIDTLQVSLDYDVTANTSLLVACSCIINSLDFEDCLRNVVSVGGDTDTYCAIAGSLAEIIWGIDNFYIENMNSYFKKQDIELLEVVNNLYNLS